MSARVVSVSVVDGPGGAPELAIMVVLPLEGLALDETALLARMPIGRPTPAAPAPQAERPSMPSAPTEPTRARGRSRATVSAAKASPPSSAPHGKTELMEIARRMLEEEQAPLAAIGQAVGKTAQTIINWANQQGWITATRRRKARHLVEKRDYSISRAAAALKLDRGRLEVLASREGWGRPVAVEPAPAPTPAPTAQVRCQECRQLTRPAEHCQHCFNRLSRA